MAVVGARSHRTAATKPIGDPMKVRRQEAFVYPNSFGADRSLRIGFLSGLYSGGGVVQGIMSEPTLTLTNEDGRSTRSGRK